MLEYGAARIALSANGISITVDGKGFTLSPGEMAMSTVFRAKDGFRKAHYVGGQDSDGDTAIDGNDNILI